MKTNPDDNEYKECEVESTAGAAGTISHFSETISVMEFDLEFGWGLSEGESDYIEKEEMKKTYDKFADLDKQLASVGLEEYSETLQKIDNQ